MNKKLNSISTAHYFSDNFWSSREKFLDYCHRVNAPISTREFFSEKDKTSYYIDFAYYGNSNPSNIVLIVSGTHGVEGYVGAACQCALLDQTPRDSQTAYVLVHALNPWGFAHNRRTNECNVDLNRNFVDFPGSIPENPDYGEYNDALLPGSWRGKPRLQADCRLYSELIRGNRKRLQSAITRGQYRFPHGLFYGGDTAQWSHRVWREILSLYGATPLSVLDLHSGLGRWGQTKLITNLPETSTSFQQFRNWFGDSVESTANLQNPIPNSSGTLVDTLPAESLSLVVEFGTYSAIRVLNALRRETINWQNGETNSELKPVFCPNSQRWREKTIRRFLEITDVYTSMLSGQLH